MNTDELKEYLAQHTDEDAYSLLSNADPNLIKRFNRVCATLKTLLSDVRQHFPEAEYYTGSGSLNIVLGRTHGDSAGGGDSPNNELCAVGASNGLSIGEGDW